MDNAMRVTEVERPQELVAVIAHFTLAELEEECLWVAVLDMLENESRILGL